MGVVLPPSEGVPEGLSADGQRRRMAGCGAQGSSVSRLSPSFPPTFPVKRLRRYSSAFIFSLSFFVLCTSFCLCRSAVHKSHLHARHTNTHILSNKLFPL